jgi:hypothetical protein
MLELHDAADASVRLSRLRFFAYFTLSIVIFLGAGYAALHIGDRLVWSRAFWLDCSTLRSAICRGDRLTQHPATGR